MAEPEEAGMLGIGSPAAAALIGKGFGPILLGGKGGISLELGHQQVYDLAVNFRQQTNSYRRCFRLVA